MGEIITKTLAEIYLRQGDLQKAYDIFRTLSRENPSDAEIQERLKELSEKLTSSPAYQTTSSTERRIQTLNRWLNNIQRRRRG